MSHFSISPYVLLLVRLYRNIEIICDKRLPHSKIGIHSCLCAISFWEQKHLTGKQKSYDWQVAPWHTFCHSNAKNKINKLFSIKNSTNRACPTIRWCRPDNLAVKKKKNKLSKNKLWCRQRIKRIKIVYNDKSDFFWFCLNWGIW